MRAPHTIHLLSRFAIWLMLALLSWLAVTAILWPAYLILRALP